MYVAPGPGRTVREACSHRHCCNAWLQQLSRSGSLDPAARVTRRQFHLQNLRHEIPNMSTSKPVFRQLSRLLPRTGAILSALFLPAISPAQELMHVESPEGWSVVSQNPCDAFIVFQNNQIRDSNFIYYLITERETIAVSDITGILTEKMKCQNPEMKKSGIGAIQVSCTNDLSISVWESSVSYRGQDTPIYSAIILKNMSREILKHELPKLVQTSMIYQDFALNAAYTGSCRDDQGDEKARRGITLPRKY